jgi:hypothetical protein
LEACQEKVGITIVEPPAGLTGTGAGGWADTEVIPKDRRMARNTRRLSERNIFCVFIVSLSSLLSVNFSIGSPTMRSVVVEWLTGNGPIQLNPLNNFGIRL